MKRLRDFQNWLTENSNESESRQIMGLPKDVMEISELYKQAGKSLYVVGGAVRDFLLGKTPKDFDLATEATPDESIKILSPHFKVLEVGKAFGVIKVITQDEPEGYEIATFRTEMYRNSNIQEFVKYIEEKKPENYEERLRIFLDLSN